MMSDEVDPFFDAFGDPKATLREFPDGHPDSALGGMFASANQSAWKAADKFMGKGDPEKLKGAELRAASRKRNKQVETTILNKAIEHYRSSGYFAFRADRYVSAGYGAPMVCQDFLGFGDALAFKPADDGTPINIAIQSTTEDGFRGHKRKFLDPATKVREGFTFELLMRWFDCGCELHFALFSQEKPGATWNMRIVNFTRDMALSEQALILARKRKPK